ncbi:hypothetical protein AK812_SmicGene9200 [Symbiodinium microadriaticum]|uniref:Uncharacterized protein n=1 Tax=Symbiodinium microadriaticum TaxID=2951 RepID=A0A1Q9EJ73_SYMMI|nr:hypothetical protein AK812_SmicGene9200 [Symbiodinium microadriaticum]CAE7030323.1 unnamed protein product [Symbiodinium sp. KB8]
MAVLNRFGAPCLRDFSSGFDQEKIAVVVSGRIRSSSLKRYLRFLEEFIFWMHRAKLRDPPFSAGDATDYLFMLADKTCGPTIPGAFISPLIASLERLVSNQQEEEAMGIRVGAFYRLYRLLTTCWGTLRCRPSGSARADSQPFFTRRRPAALGVARSNFLWRLRRIPGSANKDWLRDGWRLLLLHADFEREEFLPALKLSDDFSCFKKRTASYPAAVTLTAAVNRRLSNSEGQRLIPRVAGAGGDVDRAQRLPTILDGFGLDPRDRDILGSWRGFTAEEADRIVESFRASLAVWTSEDPIQQESDDQGENTEDPVEAPLEDPVAEVRVQRQAEVEAEQVEHQHRSFQPQLRTRHSCTPAVQTDPDKQTQPSQQTEPNKQTEPNVQTEHNTEAKHKAGPEHSHEPESLEEAKRRLHDSHGRGPFRADEGDRSGGGQCFVFDYPRRSEARVALSVQKCGFLECAAQCLSEPELPSAVWVTEFGYAYHRRGCGKLSHAKNVRKATVKEALGNGKAACNQCFADHWIPTAKHRFPGVN